MTRFVEERQRARLIPRHENDLETAFHEAGHAVGAAQLGFRIDCVSIVGGDEDIAHGGRCTLWRMPALRDYHKIVERYGCRAVKRYERSGVFIAAGPAATFLRDNAVSWSATSVSEDYAQLAQLAALLSPQVNLSPLIDDWNAQASALVSDHWDVIVRVAGDLHARRVLSGARVRALVVAR